MQRIFGEVNLEELLSGDHRTIARAISMMENEEHGAADLIKEIYKHTGLAVTVGITGHTGAGKSTLVNKLVAEFRKRGKKVGVLAFDPSSSYTGGALLGDRIRMLEHTMDKDVFIRSMASRGDVGGIASSARSALWVLEAAGKDIVILETVGIGQTEIDIVKVADVTVVVLMPLVGDEIQSMKAGIMEVGNIYVVNKADLPDADRAVMNIQMAITKKGDWRPPVLKTVAKTGDGISQLVDRIDEYFQFLEKSGLRAKQVEKRVLDDILYISGKKLAKRITAKLSEDTSLKDIADRIIRKELDPYSAADMLLGKLFW